MNEFAIRHDLGIRPALAEAQTFEPFNSDIQAESRGFRFRQVRDLDPATCATGWLIGVCAMVDAENQRFHWTPVGFSFSCSTLQPLLSRRKQLPCSYQSPSTQR